MAAMISLDITVISPTNKPKCVVCAVAEVFSSDDGFESSKFFAVMNCETDLKGKVRRKAL